MRVGVVDLGGNTARLLVAHRGSSGFERVAEDRIVLALGAEIERKGRISKSTLATTRATVADLCLQADQAGCAEVEVLVTSPGRQSENRSALRRSLSRRIEHEIRFVTAEEEARLAYAGAVACTPVDGENVAVIDVGGGSTEIAIGPPAGPPLWCRSVELGSLRLTHRCFRRHPPAKRELNAARAAVRDELAAVLPQQLGPITALATGGTARALRKLVGGSLGADELKDALAVARRMTPRRLERAYDIPAWRAATLAGGAILLAEIQLLLGVPLLVATGGVREGAALTLLDRADAA